MNLICARYTAPRCSCCGRTCTSPGAARDHPRIPKGSPLSSPVTAPAFTRERGLLRRTVTRVNGAARVDTPAGLHKNQPLSVQHDSFFKYPGSKTVTV